jgi:diaminopimelate decarboxylase
MPAAFRTNDAGHLEIDGCDVVALAEEFGAPLWVISESTVRDNYRRLRDAFRRVYEATDVLYATKANPQPAIIAAVLAEGALVDAVTLGHLKLILRAGGTPDRIVFNGNSKTEEELHFALDNRVAVINVDSLEEMQLIAGLQPVTATVPQQVCLRIAVDNTRLMAEDPILAKSDWLGKFGMDPADALAAAEIALAHPGIALAGLHNHLGFSAYGTPYTPQLDVVRHERCVEQTLDVARSIREEHGHRLAILNMGGGYRVGNPAGYGPGALTEFPTAEDYAMAVAGTARELCAEWDLGTPRLILEAGGYLVTDAVALLARVGVKKTRRAGGETREWASIENTSGYHFVRRLMFRFHHEVVVANRMNDAADTRVSISGPICADDDVADEALLPALRRGDLIAVLDNGSYCEAVTSDYCAVPIPPAVMVSEGRSALTRKRETADDIVARFDVPEWLTT